MKNMVNGDIKYYFNYLIQEELLNITRIAQYEQIWNSKIISKASLDLIKSCSNFL